MFRKFLSFLFFIVGFVLLIVFLYGLFQRVNPWGLERGFESYSNTEPTARNQIPQRIVIDSIGIDLPTVPGSIQNNKFDTTKEGVSYLSGSAVPGMPGNAIFYGHNWGNLLGNLKKVKVGDSIRIYSSPSDYSEYKIEYTATVAPDEVHILNQTEDSRITIYTCTGLFDTKRFVAVGTLVK